MLKRRTFLKYVGGTLLSLFSVDKLTGRSTVLAQSVPAGALDPLAIPKFTTPLLIPPVMPKAGKIINRRGKNIDYYEISIRQFAQQILPAGMPKTTVWGYGAVKSDKKGGLLLHNAPSLTIEANWKRPVRIKWINELRVNPADPASPYLPHLLPVDPSLHWANPPGGSAARDTRPSFPSTPGSYTGPVPIVTHVHGAADVGDESDGYAEAWYLPVAGNIPADYATEGSWYAFFKAKAASKAYLAPGTSAWQAGTAVFQYPNSHRAATSWYHDHTLGMTRVNVYAGPAGFFLIRGGPDGDASIRDSRTGTAAILPGPAPKEGDKFPSKKVYYEIPIAIQDRAFHADGSLFYPDSRAFFDGISGSYLPDSDISPIWNPEFFGNTMMVNGNTWPFLKVEQRRYRLRLLNGCNARFLILNFAAIPGVDVWKIGNEGGLLAAPVHMTALNSNQLLLAPAERADVIVDFTNVPVGAHTLGNLGPDEPFGGGVPNVDFPSADPNTTGQIMQFMVGPALTADLTTPPQFLILPAIIPLVGGTVRPLALLEEMSHYFDDAPAAAMLGVVEGDPQTGTGMAMHRMWMDPITENPAPGSTEVWEFYNGTPDAHPMHIHETMFQVVNRQHILVDEMMHTFQLAPGSVPIPPEPWENGWKDTVIAYPGQVTRVRLLFDVVGQYVWHCHIVEHEDNEMMRPYRIGPVQPGQPG